VTEKTSFSITTLAVRPDGVPDVPRIQHSASCVSSRTIYGGLLLQEYGLRMKGPAVIHSRDMRKRIQDVYYPCDGPGSERPVTVLNTALICSFTVAGGDQLLSRWKCAVIELGREHRRVFLLELPEHVDMGHLAIRQSFISVLELAESMGCSDMLALVERQRSDLVSLIRSFMYIGFRIILPNSLVHHHPDHIVLHYRL